MNLADVFTFLFSILGTLVVFLGYWLLAYALFPQLVERCAARTSGAPVKTTLLGAATLLPLVFIGLTLSGKASNGAVKVLAIGVVLVAILGALLGSAGLVLRIGTGLRSGRDETEPWRRVLRGGIVLGLTFVLPFMGQLVMLPVTLCAGFGALLLGRPKLAAAPVTAPVPEAPPLPTAAL